MIDSSAFEIAASGMAAQRSEMDIIAQNLANADAVRADGSAPYRSREAVFEPASPFGGALQSAMESDIEISFDEEAPTPQGVRLAAVVQRDTPPQLRFDPGNPLAAKNGIHKGFITVPDVDPIEQMVSLIAAGRTYDADVSTLQAAKQMDLEAADIDRP